MKNLLFTLFMLVCVVLCVSQRPKNIVCYYENMSAARPGNARFTPSSINPYICTHLIYAFAKFSDSYAMVPGNEMQDVTRNGFVDFNNLKKRNKNLKTLLSIGGWEEGSRRFSRVAASKDLRDFFINSAVELLRDYKFDGIHFDWQYPAFREGGRPEDKENYVELVRATRASFENEARMMNKTRMLVTMSVPSELEYVEQGHDLVNLNKYADFFNILAYDYHLSNEGNVSHHSPLYPLHYEISNDVNMQLNADYTVSNLITIGMFKEKLNLGIPTFGRTYKLENINEHSLGAPSKSPGPKGDFSKLDGILTYIEICKIIKNQNWTVVHVNKTALGPYAYRGEDWVGYDDEDIIRAKGEYARKQGLGGIMFWTMDDDDFRAECGKRNYPLIMAGREGILGRPEREVASTPKPVQSRPKPRPNPNPKPVKSSPKPRPNPTPKPAQRPPTPLPLRPQQPVNSPPPPAVTSRPMPTTRKTMYSNNPAQLPQGNNMKRPMNGGDVYWPADFDDEHFSVQQQPTNNWNWYYPSQPFYNRPRPMPPMMSMPGGMMSSSD